MMYIFLAILFYQHKQYFGYAMNRNTNIFCWQTKTWIYKCVLGMLFTLRLHPYLQK